MKIDAHYSLQPKVPRVKKEKGTWEPQWHRDKSVPVTTYYMESPSGTYRVSNSGDRPRPWYVSGPCFSEYHDSLQRAKESAESTAKRGNEQK